MWSGWIWVEWKRAGAWAATVRDAESARNKANLQAVRDARRFIGASLAEKDAIAAWPTAHNKGNGLSLRFRLYRRSPECG